MKKNTKTTLVIVGIIITIAIIAQITKKNELQKQQEPVGALEEWQNMTYDQKATFLCDSIINDTLVNNDNDLQIELRTLIADECRDLEILKCTLKPSKYRAIPNILSVDSGWIFMPFECMAKNDFGVDKEIFGNASLRYQPATKTLTVNHLYVRKIIDKESE